LIRKHGRRNPSKVLVGQQKSPCFRSTTLKNGTVEKTNARRGNCPNVGDYGRGGGKGLKTRPGKQPDLKPDTSGPWEAQQKRLMEKNGNTTCVVYQVYKEKVKQHRSWLTEPPGKGNRVKKKGKSKNSEERGTSTVLGVLRKAGGNRNAREWRRKSVDHGHSKNSCPVGKGSTTR